MSLVEKALKKLQENRQSAAEVTMPPAVSVGTLVKHAETIPQGAVAKSKPRVSHSGKVLHLDRQALRSFGLLPPEHQERQLSDQYRALKRPIIRTAFEQVADGEVLPRQAIMLTSALPGDGKTFTCINLSLSISLEKDHSVILVDADVAKPHISHLFGVENEPGLLDVLADPRRSIESVLLPTDIPGLSIVPAGRVSETATEHLASQRMRQLIAELTALDPKGLVLLDSPPMLLTSEAKALASWVGQVIVVVKADITPRKAVADTTDLLRGHPRVSLILNQADAEHASGYYGYGYPSAQSGTRAHHNDPRQAGGRAIAENEKQKNE